MTEEPEGSEAATGSADRVEPAGVPDRPHGGHVEWRPWGEQAFDAAADADRPVLLSLTATWSAECAEMDEATYDEPRIAAAIGDGFVPVRADVDRHPRVAARYAMGGVPSTVFLTPGGEILTGAGALAPSGMRGAIEGARRTWEEQGAAAGRVPRSLADEEPPSGDIDASIESHMCSVLRENYDERAGGWGSGAKFPLPRTVEFALKRDREMALRSLDAIAANLLDDHDGGFYRAATEPDWSGIRYGKLLDTNGALVRAFANAYRYTGDDAYREAAERTVEYLTTTLWTAAGSHAGAAERGAFAASQAAGAGTGYYTLEPAERESTTAPPVDGTVLADWNAVAVDGVLAYAAVTDDERAVGFAERALSTLVEDHVEDGVVLHARDDSAGEEPVPDSTGECGLLLDHARTIRALCRARSVLGPEPAIGVRPLDLARELADHALSELRPGDAFVDGPRRGPGLLDRPLRPLDANVELGDALLDLHALTGEEQFRTAARDATAAFAGAHERFGPRAAAFASVASRLLRGTERIDVTAPPGCDLHRAALRVADHDLVVRPGAGADDGCPVPATDEGDAAYVVHGGAVSPPARTPDELAARIADQL